MNRTMRRAQRFGIRLRRDLATRMTCEEAGCGMNAEGWATVLDVSQAEHAQMATWIKQESDRRFFEVRSDEALEWAQKNAAALGMSLPALTPLLTRTPPGMAIFIFPPGQQCFRQHLDREVEFTHQVGVQQGSRFFAERTRVHSRPLDFNEQHNEEAARINRARERG